MVKLTKFQKEDIHILLKTFFNDKGLVRQHLDSYNEFIDHGLQEVVDEVAEIPIEVPESPYKVKLGQIWVIDPQSRITGPYATEVDGTKHEIYPMEALIAAGEDPDDPGGYFVVNGSERVIVAMEDLAPNRVIVDIDEKGTAPVYQAKIFSTTVGFRARIELKLKSDDAIYVTMPGVPTEIPFVVTMRALSLEKDKDIAEAVSLDKDLQKELGPSFEKAIGAA